ncbi:thioredoxin domain-containing protein [Cytophagaceae bacterium YF14B1]|uniref:Thioredoxin domain-containing protein n=1 Tax=Xanthocytophaga flava TaxID=3048013 RepID=A0AAE3QT30_9BACT|nr:thioredoxin domain-containing protein [Xanthocytophaga flavus]MDJ1482726.1 thioredoxin domain-containing protein [Xanthocytophaga flavus]
MKQILLLLFVAVLLPFGTPLHAQSGNKPEQLTLDAFEQKLRTTTHPQILDVRTPAEFSENHLKGAVNLSVADSIGFKKGISLLDKQQPVFVYSINNGRSGQVAKQLRNQGFSSVYELPGGIAHWLGAGKPVETKAGKGLAQQEYNQLVASNELVLVEIGSKYCGGCKKLAPVVDTVVSEHASTLKLVKIELYDNRQLASQLQIESVPTLILYKNNKPVWRQSGGITKPEIEQALNKAL